MPALRIVQLHVECIDQTLAWPQQFRWAAFGEIFENAVGRVVERVDAADERPGFERQDAAGVAEERAVPIRLLLHHPTGAVRAKNVVSPDGVVILVGIGGVLWRTVFCETTLA